MVMEVKMKKEHPKYYFVYWAEKNFSYNKVDHPHVEVLHKHYSIHNPVLTIHSQRNLDVSRLQPERIPYAVRVEYYNDCYHSGESLSIAKKLVNLGFDDCIKKLMSMGIQHYVYSKEIDKHIPRRFKNKPHLYVEAKKMGLV